MTDIVALAWCSPGSGEDAFHESIIRIFMNEARLPEEERHVLRPGGGYTSLMSGPRVATARNQLVRNVLAIEGEKGEKAEWMLMLDRDMVFQPDLIDRLLEVADKDERPVIGGLCFGGGHGLIFPTMYRLVDPKEHDGVPVQHILDWPEGAVVRVDATGAACLLVHRTVLEKLWELNPDSPAPWFHESQYKGQEFGEDWTFCLRVGQAGFPIYVNTNAKVGHIKTAVLDEELWRTGRVPLKFVDGIDRSKLQQARENPLEVVDGLVTPQRAMNRQERRALERARA